MSRRFAAAAPPLQSLRRRDGEAWWAYLVGPIAGVGAVLHCAGPFVATCEPMLDACIKAGAHYLDITGELHAFPSRPES
jgi:short subunit dehydrogenase-like uncharacterized protein